MKELVSGKNNKVAATKEDDKEKGSRRDRNDKKSKGDPPPEPQPIAAFKGKAGKGATQHDTKHPGKGGNPGGEQARPEQFTIATGFTIRGVVNGRSASLDMIT